MNITILANYDLSALYCLNLLLPSLSDHNVSLFFSSGVGNTSNLAAPLKALGEYERSLVTRINQNEIPCIKSAEKLNALVGQQEARYLDTINKPEGLETIRDTQPDLILSIRFGKILKQPVIDIPSAGVINLHSGLLPQYQGVMATFHALNNGDTIIGSTLHRIDSAAIDAGPILALNSVSVNPERSYLWHMIDLYPSGIRQMIQVVRAISNDKSIPEIKKHGEPCYYTYPDDTQLLNFELSGKTLFNEQEDILQEITRNILGFESF